MLGRSRIRLAGRFAQLSSGQKLLIILSVALLPLGLIALVASLDAAHSNRHNRHVETRLLAVASARQLSSAVTRSAISLRAVATALSLNSAGPEPCARTLEMLARAQSVAARFALFSRDGAMLCATSGFAPPPPPGLDGIDPRITLVVAPQPALHFAVASADYGATAVGELPLASLQAATRPIGAARDYELELIRDGTELMLSPPTPVGRLARTVRVDVPVLDDRTDLVMTLHTAPVQAVELLSAVLPLMMWAAAAVTAWLVMDRLLLRPLAQMQRAVLAYRAGDKRLAMPAMATPATEIRGLANAFQRLAQTVAGHEAELEQGLAQQVKLTREVHHRVKNNLQVIASLLNLHARGVDDEAVAAAYASIQRRVDALAIVHRHHYAEQDETYGVQLRLMIGELAANLKGSAGDATRLDIRVDIAPLRASQDTAVPVAFLITEIVEQSILSGCAVRLTITLAPAAPGRALLGIRSDAAAHAPVPGDAQQAQRYGRIIEGLARQLRAKLSQDEAGRCYEVEIPVVGATET